MRREETTEDGNEIAFDTLLCISTEEGALISHEYSYELYEEEDGNYSFGYTFGIAPGTYFREADMAGGKEILYVTMNEFHDAVDVIAEQPFHLLQWEGFGPKPVLHFSHKYGGLAVCLKIRKHLMNRNTF